MAFFRQLQLLLWKNYLNIIRRPVWSVTLILWPIVIFIIIAVTRYQFPPVLRPTCFVGPRNLPSTGFFPFLETLMCNTDSDCHNTSRLTQFKHHQRHKRSPQPAVDSPLSNLLKGHKFNLTKFASPDQDPTPVFNTLSNFFGQGSPSSQAVAALNQTLTEEQPVMNVTESARVLKSVICNISLSLIKTPSPSDHTAEAFITFCNSDNTAFEVAINTFDQILVELMTSRPEELAKYAEKAVRFIDQLQDEAALWDCLISLPHLFNPKSPDQLLANVEKLLTNLQTLLAIMEHHFPEVKNVTSLVHPILVAGTETAKYMHNWKGKNVSIRFGDVVTGNESLWKMVGNIEIPLDKAIALAFDRKMALDFFCKNSSGPMWVAACATGSLEKALSWISPNKLAQQILLAWTKSGVAHDDVKCFKGMIHGLGGAFESPETTRPTRSDDAQPQNTEEELFLGVGQVVMEILELIPDLHAFVQHILTVGFQTMKTGTQAIVTTEEMMEDLVTDVTTVKMIFQTLMTDPSQTTEWMNQALNSTFEILVKIIAGEDVTCDTILDQFEWVFSIKTIKREVVQSLLCGNSSSTEETLLKDWMPLVENVQELYGALMGSAEDNVTLSMILSEWHDLLTKSSGFGGFLQKLQKEWGGEYWMDWMSQNSSANHLPSTIQQSVMPFVVKLMQMFEQHWPESKDYFLMAHWILNYKDTSSQPPNCKMNMMTYGIECGTNDTHFDWNQFIHAFTPLLSPTEEILISYLKRGVRLLQHVYGDFYNHLTVSNLKDAIPGGDALSDFLINMLKKLDDFARTLTTLSDQSLSDPQVMTHLYANLLESIGLKPLLPLLTHDGPVNMSLVLEVASKLGRSNQGIFTFNESDPTMAQLDDLIFNILSMEGNLSLSLYFGMSENLLTYYSYFDQEYVAKLKQALKPFTNQTSSGVVETILSCLELLKTISNAPNGDPTHIILGYVHHIQQFLMSMFRMQRFDQIVLPNGQVTAAQTADLQLLSNVLNLLTPEMIMNLTQCGPVAAQHMIIEKYIHSLPPQVRDEARDFLHDFTELQIKLAQCGSSQDCLTGISEMLDFLKQILDMAVNTNGNATINIAATKMYMGRKQFIPVASAFLSLTLKPDDAAYVKIVHETIDFISILLDHPNISLSNVQAALTQANLTIEELNDLMMWLGAKDVNDLLNKVTQLENAQKCFEETSLVSVAHCAVGMVKTITELLTGVPALKSQVSILSLIPNIVNKTVTDMIKIDFTGNPQNTLAEALKASLASVKMTLQLNNLSTPEIQKEIEVLECLIKLVADPEPLKYLGIQPNDFNMLEAPLRMVLWYCERLENITSSSSVSDLLHPIFRITQMQVAMQLAQIHLTQFINEQVLNLTNSLTHPINEEGVGKIWNTTTAILEHVMTFVVDSIEAQNAPSDIFGYDPPINMTHVNAIVEQINHYIEILHRWMHQAHFGLWGSLNNTTVIEDINHLLESTLDFFGVDLRGYIQAIQNITQSLDNALTVAMHPNGLHSEQFIDSLLNAVQGTMDLLNQGSLFESIKPSIKMVVKNSVWLASAPPDASYAMSLSVTRQILHDIKIPIVQIFPEEVAMYLCGALEIVKTYFDSLATVAGPDSVNQIILNEMTTVESLLPPNSTAQIYVSTAISVTKVILQPVHDNQSLLFLDPTEQNILQIVDVVGKVLNMVCPLFLGESCNALPASPLEGFVDLPHVLEMLMTGHAINDTWRKLQEFAEIILSFIEPGMPVEDFACFVEMFEMAIGNEVKNTKAQTDFILSLQAPVMTLITNFAHSLNGSHFNLTEVSERLETAIEDTITESEKTNGTLTCQEALELWEPVREAAGLSPSIMATWCNISLQPVIDGYVTEMSQNWTCTEMGPVSAKATAARMITTVRSMYHSQIKQSHVTDGFIEALSTRFSALLQWPLSHKAELNMFEQLQQWQIQNSLQSIELLSEQLENEFPEVQTYLDAVEKMITHIVKNQHRIGESDDVFKEAAKHLLLAIKVSPNDIDQILSGTFSGDAWLNAGMKTLNTMMELNVFGNNLMFYHTLEQLLVSNDTRMVIHKVADMVSWLTSTPANGHNFIAQALVKTHDLLTSLLSVLSDMDDEVQPYLQVLHNLLSNAVSLVEQVLTSGRMRKGDHYGMQHHALSGNTTGKVRRKREASYSSEVADMSKTSIIDDYMDLIFIDYHGLARGLSVPPTSYAIMGTVNMAVGNPDLRIVLEGSTKGLEISPEISTEEIIEAILRMATLLTVPGTDYSSLHLWDQVINYLPDSIPHVALLKNITHAIANESPEKLRLMQDTFGTVSALVMTGPTDPRLLELLEHLRAQVCELERTDTAQIVERGLSMEPGILCDGVVPLIEIIAEGVQHNTSALLNDVFQVLIGEPGQYHIKTDWTYEITHMLGLNMTTLSALNFTTSTPDMKFEEMLRSKTAFMTDMEKSGINPMVAHKLMETRIPDNNLQILSWLFSLRHCPSEASKKMNVDEETLKEMVCLMPPEETMSFVFVMAKNLDMHKFTYRMMLPTGVQSLVSFMIDTAGRIIMVMKKMLPAVHQLEEYVVSFESLSLDPEFQKMARSQRTTVSSGATFVTISRALCSKGILALFGVAKNPHMSMAPPSFDNHPKREEMIQRFKIPRNATPFCTNMYLDMVNTTGGAIAWAFLKPMLMGKLLFTPDTAQTRAIMHKSNRTLQQLADLRYYSQDWIKSSNYIVKSSEMLTQTLPLLQNSLSNSFVKNFIQMQTGINVDSMRETLNNFSNMTLLLEKNKDLLGQITTLSRLMVDLSSCITFDRYQGYDSEDELNRAAQDLAKDRNLYASVIFKLPKDKDSSNVTTLPPKVRYTIRMHMDNLMRTDRVRQPYFTKETHISAAQTLRYNRGFIYLQETIDRAIVDIQANRTVTDTAVQIQPFPYPCHHRDEYLEAIAFVFPLLLMIAWVLFVADFVKKLVHEREIKLHEYMKMMGVNPLSHFFAWFLESAFYLVLTIFFLTLVLKYGNILPHSNGFLLFLYLCDYGLSILAFSFLISTFFDKTYIAALSGSLLYVLAFFPFIIVMALEARFSFSVKSLLGLFSPTAFSYASQYVSRYETQGEGIQWSNSYSSPIAGDTASFGWLCWLMLIDTFLYFIIGAYIRTVFPGKSGIPSPWYFPFTSSFWKDLFGCRKSKSTARGLFLPNIMHAQAPEFPDNGKEKGKGDRSSKASESFSDLPVGVSLYGLTKVYGQQAAIENLNVAFYEGHVTTLLGHNGAGKTTTMSILTGLFPPSSGVVEVYGRDMQANLEDVRKELGVCMQYDVLFDHMTAKEHLLLYGQIKAPHWSKRELQEQVRTILQETGMYAHRHKRVGTLSGGMKRKLSISIAFIGGSRLVVLDEPTTGVDPCSRRSIWDIVIQHKKGRTIIMSTHHLDEAEVLSDRIAFLERGGLKCCGSPYYLKEQLGQGYKLTLTKQMRSGEAKQVDGAELKAFVQAHVPEARLKEAQGSDLVYLLPPFSSNNASSYRSLLTALDSNLDALQLGGYGISDTTLEEVFLHLTHGSTDAAGDELSTISDTVSDTDSVHSYPESEGSNYGDTVSFTGTPTVSGVKLAWQQTTAILIKRFHHSRRDWKGLISQILLPALFVAFAMGLGTIKSDLRHYPEMELTPALYNIGPTYSFFSNPNSSKLADTMLSYPGLDNACLKKSNPVCTRSGGAWTAANGTKKFSLCKCVHDNEVCGARGYVPPHKRIPSSQIVYNVTDLNMESYLVASADDYIRNRYGGFDFGLPLPRNLRMDVKTVPKNRTLSKVWFNPEGHHTMPAYLSSMNNFILRSNLPADKDPRQYAISVSSHPYFGRPDDEDSIVQGMLQIMVALCVLAGYSITTASFAIYEVNEHHTGSKRLQHIAGISEPFYWIVNFFYDMVVYMIPVTLTVAVIAAFQVPAFTDRQNLGAVAMILVLFGFATFPWMYLLSSVFKGAEMAFITYVCINLFLSVNTIIPTSILYFMRQISFQNTKSLKIIFDRLSYAFLIFPQFNFGNGLLELARTNIEVQLLSGYGIDAYKDPFSTDALGLMMISSFVQGVVLFALRLFLNKYIIRKIRRLILRRKPVHLVPRVDEDEDVAAEHLRVSSGAASSDVLQVNQLTKVYQHLNKKVPAVNKLSLGVPAGECFGLLGVNGAGKTTTFKMLTGDVSPTDGTAQIRDRNGRLVNIMECRNQGINIGYCPQVDALDDLLTGEEHLYFYARLHGISKRDIPGVVNYLLRRVELNQYRDTIADSYSCGTRRKLSTALALVGHPQILLLDEPSSGMDPRTKRQLWKIISEEVRGKCAVVLTSHSMEECEALCGRLAIMVKGQFQCLGSLQHIKNRFGSGFTVKMYLVRASSDADAITRFMQSRFPSTYLKEQHSAMVEYHVPVAPGGVADIFGQLESSKEYLEIQHFSVSQTTLDEVFINFAMEKTGMETIPIDDESDDTSLKDVDA